MTAGELLSQLFLGGLLGAVGQGIRVIVGLKKVWDQTRTEGVEFASLFRGNAIFVSLLIGFVAGVLGILSISDLAAAPRLDDRQTLVTLIGIGYAGADFIEGFMQGRLASAPAAAVKPIEASELEPPPVG